MVIVAGHVVVDAQQRDDYLSGCVEVVRHARRTPGCLDFSLSADLLEPGRINVFERWESVAAVEAFRGSGPSDEQVPRSWPPRSPSTTSVTRGSSPRRRSVLKSQWAQYECVEKASAC